MFIAGGLLLSLRCAAQAPPARQPTEGENLALGKVCTFDPAPDYGYCTDADDPKQLTDGLYNGCNWVDKGTVGWGVGRDRVKLVALDLGTPLPIGKVTFDSVTGAAQVTFPSAALVFVSTDGQNYRYLCDILTESLPQDKPLNYRFVAEGLKGWGRYVRIAIVSGGFYLFCDEIEIMKGHHGMDESRYADDTPIPADRVKAYATDLIPWVTQKNATLTLLREAEEAVAAREKAVRDKGLIAEAKQRIREARTQLLADRSVVKADYRQGPPCRSYDRSAFEAVAGLNAKLWPQRPFVVWRDGDWTWLHPLGAPIGKPLGATLRVAMMNNEWATASFIVTSASTKSQELSLSATEFRGPQNVAADRLLRIGHVVHVEAFGYNYRDDAVVPQSEGPIVLAPGVSKRIWLTFKTRGMELKPGAYASTINVAVGGKKLAQVPVELRIWPLRFPDEVSLHSNTWGYFESPPVVGHEEAAAQDLLDHYNTALTLHHGWIPYPKPDKDGNFAEPLDFSRMDKMLAWNPKTRLWLIWTGFEFGYDRLGTAAFGTPTWEKVFTQWVTQIRDHLAEKGVRKNQFAWYWVDEPGGATWDKICVPASKLLKKIDPEMLTWENVTSGLTHQQIEASLPYFDVYCPNDGVVADASIVDLCHRTKLKSWFYACASEKNASPFAYYRWFSWKAWKLGLGGIGMWIYVDENGVTFSDYTTGVSYGLIYQGDRGVIDSKRWEAWRQGIADYEYLRMLSDAVAATTLTGKQGRALEQAQALLSQGVDDIVGDSPYGGDPRKAEAPDAYRLRILECLAELQK